MKFAIFKEVTRLEQTAFALPFTVAGAMLSLLYPSDLGTWISWIWIIQAFLFARISGMAFNQFIDRKFDARNPRTAKRAIPTGRVKAGQVYAIAWISLILFLIVCFQINAMTAALAMLAAILVYVYSYMKRIHYSCHFVLGAIHCLAPVMACAALTGRICPAACLLGGAAAFSIAGNDIAYAIQDVEFDLKERLCSIPAHFGIEKSLSLIAASHVLCVLFLILAGLSAQMPFIYYLLAIFAGVVFFRFHQNLHTNKTSLHKIESSFFLCNVLISFSSLFFVAISVIWRVIS